MYGTDEYDEYDKRRQSTASADRSDDEYNEYNSDDRTSILVILHNTSFRDTMLPAATWHMHPDDANNNGKYGNTLGLWIELTQMWLELVSFDSPAHYPHEYKFVRKINLNEQIREVLHQYYDTPVVQVRRTNATGSSSSSSAAKRRRLV